MQQRLVHWSYHATDNIIMQTWSNAQSVRYCTSLTDANTQSVALIHKHNTVDGICCKFVLGHTRRSCEVSWPAAQINPIKVRSMGHTQARPAASSLFLSSRYCFLLQSTKCGQLSDKFFVWSFIQEKSTKSRKYIWSVTVSFLIKVEFYQKEIFI